MLSPSLSTKSLASAPCCRRSLTSSSRFLSSDSTTKSRGTQEASHSAAQPPQKSKDRSCTARLATHSLINFCTKHLGTGHPALKTSNAIQDKNSFYKEQLECFPSCPTAKLIRFWQEKGRHPIEGQM